MAGGTVPLLRWAGGKRWLAPRLAKLIPEDRRLIEPFAGAAAVSLACSPRRFILSDTNDELMNFYRQVQRDPDSVSDGLASMRIDARTFKEVATSRPTCDTQRARRFIYLNKTAFGGLWRVNQTGQFNVPFGCRETTSMPSKGDLRSLSRHLGQAELVTSPFNDSLVRAGDRDVVYCDPPYTVNHNRNGFVRYNERLFSWSDQQRLAKVLGYLATEGVGVIASNAMHTDVLELYPAKLFWRFAVSRRSALAPSVDARGIRDELVVVSRLRGWAGAEDLHLLGTPT